MRRIVENLGMDWSRQMRRLEAEAIKFNCGLMSTVGADGRSREMLAMPVRKIALWPATINPNKVRADLRAQRQLWAITSGTRSRQYQRT